MKYIDAFLNNITMYRLVLYHLLVIIGISIILSFFGLIPYSFFAIIFSTAFLVAVSWIVNKIFGHVFEAPTNTESVYISALILALIIKPATSIDEVILLFWASVLMVASKFIIAISKKHVLNPVAIAVAITAFFLGQSANWWVGNAYLMPIVTVGGLLIVRKLEREDMVYSFVFSALVGSSIIAIARGTELVTTFQQITLHSSLFFLAFIMLTEPLTTPPTNTLQIVYGALVGILFIPQIHLGSFFSTPELALLAGNIFSYFVSPKEKLLLHLKEKVQLSSDMYDFIFPNEKKISFTPGQYMEWTYAHPNTDSRGNRRYFTLASSPTEDTLRIGVKFYPNSSSYKRNLLTITPQQSIVASSRAGNFTLPNNPDQKLVFIAGGIGITPFRSILKYLIDTNQKRNIVLFYSNKNPHEIIYKEIFDDSEKKLGIKTIYTVTDMNSVSNEWTGKTGRISKEMIMSEIPDYNERLFYLSGPHAMVEGFKTTLKEMNIPSSHIKTDYFPGFV